MVLWFGLARARNAPFSFISYGKLALHLRVFDLRGAFFFPTYASAAYIEK
jgi:hypothetical protein